MADVTITSLSDSNGRGMRSVVFKKDDPNTGYWFFTDSANLLVYTKTTDGGATWGAAVTIEDTAVAQGYDICPDWWMPGDTGTLIHIWWTQGAVDDVLYRTLDVSTDTLGAESVVFDGASVSSGRGVFVSGTKTRSGYLYSAFDIDAGAEKGLYRSTDAGVNWSLLSEPFVEATIDQCFAFPALNTGDDNDALFLYHDASTDELTLKLWDSSGAVASESAVIATVIENTTDNVGQYGFSASVRHSDGKIICVVVTERDTATADHRVFELDCTGPGSFTITELTAIATNVDDHYYPALFIDQLTDKLIVAYNGKRDGSETLGTTSKVYTTESTDDGATWSPGDTVYMEDAAAAVVQIWAPLMGPRFYTGWRIGTTFMGNAVNSLTFEAAVGDFSEDFSAFPLQIQGARRTVTVFA